MFIVARQTGIRHTLIQYLIITLLVYSLWLYVAIRIVMDKICKNERSDVLSLVSSIIDVEQYFRSFVQEI